MSQKVISRGHFGLYYKDPQGNSHPIPLRTIDVNVRIMESIARVEYSQVYQNNTPDTIHVDYIFPISTESCFESFSVKYKSYTMEGEIHKKEHAQKKFKEAVKEGKTAAYAEITEESKDLMLVKIGNMEPDTTMTINLSYIEQLDTSANKLWKYTVLGSLKPRYASPSTLQTRNNAIHGTGGDISILNYPYISSNDPEAYKWKIKVEIESRSKITFVECPSYKIQTEYDEMVKAIVQLDPTEEFVPTRDFTIYYSTEAINKPQALLTSYEDGYCALVNFLPQTNQKSLNDAYRAELETDGVPDIEFESTRGEFIFLIDRSGSMSGSSIKMAREALVIFLKSIPANSYFNIVSFGGHHEVFSQRGSLPATEENINDATKDVMRYEGDMGGTEILKALETVYNLKSEEGFKKKIFLLTDGDVYDKDSIFRSIQNHTDEARVFSIGIGQSACKDLIIQSAHYGKGCYEFVDDVNKIGERVVSLLTLSMQICAHSFQMTFPMGLDPQMVVPHPEIVGPVYEGKYLSFFVYFDKQIMKRESVKLNLIYRRDEKTEGSQQTIELLTKDCLNDANPLNQAIWKLGYHKLFSLFEAEKDKETDTLVLFGGKPLTKNDIEPLSVKYRVLSQKTAFVCVSKDINNQVLSTIPSEVVVPHILSDESRQRKSGRMFRRGSSSGSRSRSRSGSPLALGVQDVLDAHLTLSRFESRYQSRNERTKSRSNRSRSRDRERGGRDRDRDRNERKESKNLYKYVEQTDDLSILKLLPRDERSSREKEKAIKRKFCFDSPPTEREMLSTPEYEQTSQFANIYKGPELLHKAKAAPKVSSYDEVFSLIRQQDSKGKWEYSQSLLNQLGVTEQTLESLVPEIIKQMKAAQAIIITALVLVCLKQKYAEHQKVWMLVFKKGESFLKEHGVTLQDFKCFEALL